MLIDVLKIRYLDNHRLEIFFEDGVTGIVDFAEFVKFEGVFQTLSRHEEFKKAFVNKEIGTICWPNGADFSSDVLYSKITKKPIDFNSPQKIA